MGYEAYLGSARGSVWTMSAGAGNSLDQASLLVALLRASGIPARYVQGWIELSGEQLISLLGGQNITVNDTSYAMSFDQAVSIIDSVAIPYVKKASSIEMEHAWVEAALPTNASYNTTMWSFEELEFEGMTLGEGVGIPAIKSLKKIKMVQPGYYWQSYDPVMSGYTVLSSIKYGEVPDELRHKVHLTTTEGLDSGLLPLVSLAKEKIILKYEPADQSLDLLGDSSLYRILDAGGKEGYMGEYSSWWGYWTSGPTYAYAVPTLIIGNETVSNGSIVRIGTLSTLTFNFSYAGSWRQNYKTYLVGDMYSVTLSPAYEPPSRITEESAKVTELYQEYNATNNASTFDEMVSQMLYTTGITYYAAYDKTKELSGEVFFTKSYNPMTRADYVARGARYYEMWYGSWGFYDVYANYRPSAVGHDFPVNILRDYSTIGQEEGRTAFHLLGAGFAGSGWESQSIYSLYNTTAVSTTYILAYAQNQSMPIYTLNQSNINDTIGNLTQPDWVKDWVKGAVEAGYICGVPLRK